MVKRVIFLSALKIKLQVLNQFIIMSHQGKYLNLGFLLRTTFDIVCF